MSDKITPLLAESARWIAKLASADDRKVLEGRADLEAERDALRDERAGLARRMAELSEVARAYDERIVEILNVRPCVVKARTFAPGGLNHDYALWIDHDGCVSCDRLVDSYDFAGRTTPAPASSGLDDISDEEFEDMVSQVKGLALADLSLHPFARLVRSIPDDRDAIVASFALPDDLNEDRSPGPGYGDDDATGEFPTLASLGLAVAVIDQEAS